MIQSKEIFGKHIYVTNLKIEKTFSELSSELLSGIKQWVKKKK